MRRQRMGRKHSRRSFKKYAKRVHRRNNTHSTSRGGIRL